METPNNEIIIAGAEIEEPDPKIQDFSNWFLPDPLVLIKILQASCVCVCLY